MINIREKRLYLWSSSEKRTPASLRSRIAGEVVCVVLPATLGGTVGRHCIGGHHGGSDT